MDRRGRMKRIALGLVLLTSSAVTLAAEAVAPAARIIVLVRHGHYDTDPAADPKLGPHVSSIGVAQARLAGGRLASSPDGFDAMYVSPMQRARDTAAAISGDFPGRTFSVIDGLAECTPPTRVARLMAEEKPEDLAACEAQLDKVFKEQFKPAQGTERTELYVCHGNVIRYLVTRALGVDPIAWLGMSVGHASITRIRVEADGSFKVISVGDVGHLPGNMLTGATGDPERSLDLPALPLAK